MLASCSRWTVSINSSQANTWPATRAQKDNTQCLWRDYSINSLILLLKIAPWGRQPLAVGRWLSYSGVVRILFPEQLRAVTKRLCRCHVIHSVSILKVSMCGAGVCPGIHRGFPKSLSFSGWKEIRLLCRDLLPKRKKYFLCETSVLAADMSEHVERYRRLLGRSGTIAKINWATY